MYHASLHPGCPTCGQFLTYLEKLTEAQDHVRRLTMELENLREMGVVNKSAVCQVMVHGQEEFFSHGNFKFISPSVICYCDVRQLDALMNFVF